MTINLLFFTFVLRYKLLLNVIRRWLKFVCTSIFRKGFPIKILKNGLFLVSLKSWNFKVIDIKGTAFLAISQWTWLSTIVIDRLRLTHDLYKTVTSYSMLIYNFKTNCVILPYNESCHSYVGQENVAFGPLNFLPIGYGPVPVREGRWR